MPRDFYAFLASRFASGTALTMLRTAVAWHVFELSRSALHLGLVGLVQFAPVLVLTMIGGAVADSYDRRRVINLSQLVLLATGLVLLQSTRAGTVSVPLLFAAVALSAAAGSFEAPSRSALLPNLVTREQFPRAVTIASTNQALAFATGPALGGLLIGRFGIAATYAAYVGLVIFAFFGVLSLRLGGQAERRGGVSFAAIREGIAFVWRHPVILGCMALDMFAVTFGAAAALLPIYAKDILHAGPTGYGLLTSSFEAGALLMSVLLMLRGAPQAAGRSLLVAVAMFGLAIIVFGVSRAFPLSLLSYMAAGMADQVSVVLRATAVQLSTPDALRGRVSAVNAIFIGASNQLGAAESGFVAHLTTPTFSVVSGGVACLLIVAFVAYKLPELRKYRIA